MDKTLFDDIRHRMHQYRTAIREIRDHASERSSLGMYRAGAPYFIQYPLRDILASAQGDDPHLETFRAEYDTITRDLKTLESEGGRAYREELFRELNSCTEAYRTRICFYEMSMGENGCSLDFSIREEIGILLLELRRDFPLTDLEREIAYLDDTLEKICMAVNESPDKQSVDKSHTDWQKFCGHSHQKETAGLR